MLILKFLIRFCQFALAVTPITTSFAVTVPVPNDESVATVEIPNDWRRQETGEFLELTTPDGVFHVLFLSPEGKKVGESIGEAIRYIRRDGAITVKPGSLKRDTSKFRGRDMSMLSWQGDARNQPIDIRCYVIPITTSDTFLAVAWGSTEAHQQYGAPFRRLLDSLKPCSGEDPNSAGS
jgi:hypothetical protein